MLWTSGIADSCAPNQDADVLACIGNERLLGGTDLDLLILIAISWLTLLGWVLGGRRALVLCASLTGAAFVATRLAPWWSLVAHDPSQLRTMLAWIERKLMRSVPALVPLHSIRFTLRAVYPQLVSVGYAVGTTAAFAMALGVSRTLWTRRDTRWYGSASGAALGLLGGLYAAAALLRLIALAAWLRVDPLWENALQHSLFAYVWMLIARHDIFRR